MASITASPSGFRSLQHPTLKDLPVKSMDPPTPCCLVVVVVAILVVLVVVHSPTPDFKLLSMTENERVSLGIETNGPYLEGPTLGPHVTPSTTGFPGPHRTHSVLSRIPSWPRNKTSCLSPNPAAWKTTRPRCPSVCSRKAWDFPWALFVYRRAFFT